MKLIEHTVSTAAQVLAVAAPVAWQVPQLPQDPLVLVLTVAALALIVAFMALKVVSEGRRQYAEWKHVGERDRRVTENRGWDRHAAQLDEIHAALLRKDENTKRSPIDQLMLSVHRLLERVSELIDEFREQRGQR